LILPHYGYGEEPIVFIRHTSLPAHSYLAYGGYSNSNPSFPATQGIYLNHVPINWMPSGTNVPSFTIEYIVLISTTNSAESGYGIALYNEAGQKILSSGNANVAIDGITLLPNGYYTTNPTVTYPTPPAGTKRYVLLNTMNTFWEVNENYDGGSLNYNYTVAFQFQSNTTVFYPRCIRLDPFNPTGLGNFSDSSEIIDNANARYGITGYF
jgi:hypothetical protein